MSTYFPPGGGPPQVTARDITRRTKRQLLKGARMAKSKPPRLFALAEITDQFRLDEDGTPPIEKTETGWCIRVITRIVQSHPHHGYGTYLRRDQFRLNHQGQIVGTPRGLSKYFQPGRVLVEELEQAARRYREEEHRP